VQEEALAPPRHQPRLRLAAKAAVHRAKHLVDRRAFLRARGEVEAAQHRIGLVAGRLEHLAQEIGHRIAQDRHLPRQAEDRDARHAVVFLAQPVDHLVRQARDQRVELLAHPVMRGLLAVLGLEGRAPDLLAAAGAERSKVFAEPGDQVGLGKHHIDREIDLQRLVNFRETGAHGPGMGRHGFGRGVHQVRNREGKDHAVDRLLGAVALQQRQERGPAFAIRHRVAVLRGVAAGGVDQHRLLGKPPVAIARAAKARKAPLPLRLLLVRQRELDPGVHQRGGLARAGGADDHIPGKVVKVGLGLARLLQRRQRRLHPFGKHRAIARRCVGDQRLFQRGLAPAAAVQLERAPDQQGQHHQPDDRQAHPDRLERQRGSKADQRPGEPDGDGEGDRTKRGQGGFQPAHRGSSCLFRWARVMATSPRARS